MNNKRKMKKKIKKKITNAKRSGEGGLRSAYLASSRT
jgi:hypothetical protein